VYGGPEAQHLLVARARDLKGAWTLVIRRILITEMAKHFEFLKMADSLVGKGPLDMNNQRHRITLLQLILKCGNVSNVSRPFELVISGGTHSARSSSGRKTWSSNRDGIHVAPQ
jgi:hypothetical protein